MADKNITLTEAQLKALVRDTVNETLTKLGVDVHKPLEMQADFLFLHELREASSTVRKKGLAAFIGIVVAGLCATFWLGFKDYFN